MTEDDCIKLAINGGVAGAILAWAHYVGAPLLKTFTDKLEALSKSLDANTTADTLGHTKTGETLMKIMAKLGILLVILTTMIGCACPGKDLGPPLERAIDVYCRSSEAVAGVDTATYVRLEAEIRRAGAKVTRVHSDK